MQKKYSSDNKTVHLTKGDLNSPVSIVNWIENTFSEVKVKDLSYENVLSALDVILHDKNFISLSDKKRKEFIPLINELKNKINTNKKLF